MTTIECIRLIGNEFDEVTDDELENWVEFCKPFVSKKIFGKLYERALALMVCHKMKMVGKGDNALGEFGKIGVGFTIGSVSEGGSSISFGAGQSSNTAKDAELALTVYGLQFITLKRQVVVPMRIRGEESNYLENFRLSYFGW